MTLEGVFKSIITFDLRRLLWPAVGLAVLLPALWGFTLLLNCQCGSPFWTWVSPSVAGKVLLGVFLVAWGGTLTLIHRNRR